MGIGIGQNWRHAIFFGITGLSAFYRFGLLKTQQQRLLKVARHQIFSSAKSSQAVTRSAEGCARDYAIIAIMLYGGLFIEEVVSLEANSIIAEDDENFSIFITGSNGEKRCQPLISKVAVEAVSEYLTIADRKTDRRGPLFLSTLSESREREPLTAEFLFSLLELLMQEAAIPSYRITPYALRNSFSKEWLDSGRDVRKLQEILGIKDSRSMSVYVAFLDDFFINDDNDDDEG